MGPREVTCAPGRATWVEHAATPATDRSQALAFDVDGATIYAAGDTRATSGPLGCTDGASPGTTDLWVAGVRPTGGIRWCTRLGGDDDQRVYDVAPLPDGGAVVAGSFVQELRTATGALCSAADGREHAFAVTLMRDGAVDRVLCDDRPEGSFGYAVAVGDDDVYLMGFDHDESPPPGIAAAAALWTLRWPLSAPGCSSVTSCARYAVAGELYPRGDIVLRRDVAAGEPTVVLTAGYERAMDSSSTLPLTVALDDPTPNRAPGAVLLVGLDADLQATNVAAIKTDRDCTTGSMQLQTRDCAVGRALLDRGDRLALLLDHRHGFVPGVDVPQPAGRDMAVVLLDPVALGPMGPTARFSSFRNEEGVDLVATDDPARFLVVGNVRGEELVVPGGSVVEKAPDLGMLVFAVNDALAPSPPGGPVLLVDGLGTERAGRAAYRQGLFLLPGTTNGARLRIGAQTLFQVGNDDGFIAAFAY